MIGDELSTSTRHWQEELQILMTPELMVYNISFQGLVGALGQFCKDIIHAVYAVIRNPP